MWTTIVKQYFTLKIIPKKATKNNTKEMPIHATSRKQSNEHVPFVMQVFRPRAAGFPSQAFLEMLAYLPLLLSAFTDCLLIP